MGANGPNLAIPNPEATEFADSGHAGCGGGGGARDSGRSGSSGAGIRAAIRGLLPSSGRAGWEAVGPGRAVDWVWVRVGGCCL